MGALQRLVDQLSEAFGRPVLVDDPDFRPLAYSAHDADDLDDVRFASILGRRARPEVVERLNELGVAELREPLRIEGDREIGLGPRWCAPIRSKGLLLGYTWVISDDELGTGESDRLSRFVEAAAVVMCKRSAVEWDGREHNHRVLRELVNDDPAVCYDAAARLVGNGVVGANQSVLMLVAELDGGRPLDDASRVLTNLGMQNFAEALGKRGVLGGVWADHGVCLIARHDAAALAQKAKEHAKKLRECLIDSGDNDLPVAVGVSAVGRTPADARIAYKQARWAANVAGRIPEHESIACWDDLGVYQLLGSVDASWNALPPGLRNLFESPNSEMLIETLEVYLDAGGDAQATAAKLFLARGSLYYRLRRIEELAEVDLRRGSDRLSMHLGLKLARLAGIWSYSSEGSTTEARMMTMKGAQA